MKKAILNDLINHFFKYFLNNFRLFRMWKAFGKPNNKISGRKPDENPQQMENLAKMVLGEIKIIKNTLEDLIKRLQGLEQMYENHENFHENV